MVVKLCAEDSLRPQEFGARENIEECSDAFHASGKISFTTRHGLQSVMRFTTGLHRFF